MKCWQKQFAIILLFLSGPGYIFSMGPGQPPESKSSLAASIAKYGLLGTGAATLVMTLAQRRLPSLSTFAKTGVILFALAALYKSPVLVRSFFSMESDYPDFEFYERGTDARAMATRRDIQERESRAKQEEMWREMQTQKRKYLLAQARIKKESEASLDSFQFEQILMHEKAIISANFSPDSKKIVATGEKSYLWDIMNEKQVLIESGPDYVTADSSSFTPDGSHFVMGGVTRCIHIFDALTGKAVHPLQEFGRLPSVLNLHRKAHFSPEGTKIITSAFESPRVQVWDAQTYDVLFSLESELNIYTNFSSDGTKIIIVGYDGSVSTYDVQSKNRISKTAEELDFLSDRVSAVDVSPDGKKMVFVRDSRFADYSVYLIDSEGSVRTKVLNGHTDVVCSARFNHAGTKIVTASRDKTVRIWNVQTGEIFQILEGYITPVNSAIFSRDDNQIVTASTDGAVCIWRKPSRIESGKSKQHFAERKQEAGE